MLLWVGISTYCGFVANRALHHVLVKLAVQVDERLAHATVYDWNATGVRAGNGGVRRGQLRWKDTSLRQSHIVQMVGAQDTIKNVPCLFSYVYKAIQFIPVSELGLSCEVEQFLTLMKIQVISPRSTPMTQLPRTNPCPK